MNLCNDPDHGAINAERAESRGLRKAWVELDDKRQTLERELTTVTKERDEARGQVDALKATALSRLRSLSAAREERDEARGQRDRLAELRNKNAIHFNELLELCGTLRKERNRLAKALRECREDSYELLAERDWWKNETRIGYQERYKVTLANTERATEALQSLTPNEP
jgi:uncharacterized coiled-coil DUF342 family protein